MDILGWKIERDKPKTAIPDTVGELLGQSRTISPPIPANAIGAVTLYEMPNHDLMLVSAGNVDPVDSISARLFKFAYEFARFGMKGQ